MNYYPIYANNKNGGRYHKKIVTHTDGTKFDSMGEMARYTELSMLVKAGKINNLEKQVKFEIVPKKGKNKRARYYYADFVYEENGKKIIEDVKSKITCKDALYSLKKALILALYPDYEFREYIK